MRYLFFDFECSNCYQGNGKICEFGYVITDENFKIQEEDSIPMSPGRHNKFDKGIYKRDPSFQYAWDYDYYFGCPEFPEFYEDMKYLFEEDDFLIFGYAVDNDIRYLTDTCKRYKKELIRYTAYDVKPIFNKSKIIDHKTRGLQNTFREICTSYEKVHVQGHLARDDAYMTMRLLQECCKQKNLTVKELIEQTPDCKYDAIKYYEDYQQHKVDKKLKTVMKLNKDCDEKWKELTAINKDNVTEEFAGRIITISANIKSNETVFNNVCNKIEDDKLVPTMSLKKSNYLICLDENDENRLKQILKEPYNGKIMLYEEFIKGNCK